MSQSIFVLTQAIKELCGTSSGQQFSALSTDMVCCTPSYYAHSLGPVRVARILICKGCNFYIASMNDLLSRVCISSVYHPHTCIDIELQGYSGTHSAKAGLFENAYVLFMSATDTPRVLRCVISAAPMFRSGSGRFCLCIQERTPCGKFGVSTVTLTSGGKSCKPTSQESAGKRTPMSSNAISFSSGRSWRVKTGTSNSCANRRQN